MFLAKVVAHCTKKNSSLKLRSSQIRIFSVPDICPSLKPLPNTHEKLVPLGRRSTRIRFFRPLIICMSRFRHATQACVSHIALGHCARAHRTHQAHPRTFLSNYSRLALVVAKFAAAQCLPRCSRKTMSFTTLRGLLRFRTTKEPLRRTMSLFKRSRVARTVSFIARKL